MTARGLRLPLPSDDVDRGDCLEYARLADELGYDAVWVPEAWGRNAVGVLAQLAARFETADVCSGIFNVYSRSPALLAMTAADLVEAGDVGVRLGLGVSNPAVVEGLHGVDFDRPLRRTREYVEVIEAFLDGETVEYDGEVVDPSGFALDPPAEYDVPIYLAAMGRTNLQLLGEFADGWLPIFVPDEAFDDAMAPIRTGLDRRDRPPEAVEAAPFVVTCVSEADPAAARDHVRSLIAFYVGAMGEFYRDTFARFGYGDVADAVRDAWQAGDTDCAREHVTDDVLDSFAICGDETTAAERVAAYREAGADQVVAYVPPRAPPSAVESTIRAFANL